MSFFWARVQSAVGPWLSWPFPNLGERVDFANSWENQYAVKILGSQVAEEDPGNDCRNYPNDDFLSYKDCDDDYGAETDEDASRCEGGTVGEKNQMPRKEHT